MHKPFSYLANWKWSALAIAAIVILSLTPQIRFWLVRGSQWQGSYATLQGDEFLYAGYLNALIDGRTRRNDPVSGQNNHPRSPLHESLYSIQIVPAFTIAFLARALGASAATAFIILLGTAGLLAGVSLLWLFASVTRDNQFAAVGALAVVCFGALAAGHGVFGLILNPSEVKFLGFPFLRRYLPSAPFPFFFIFCGLIWHSLITTNKRSSTALAAAAGLVISLLVFSYFYLWTAAAAWFVSVVALCLVFKTRKRAETIRVAVIVVAITIIPLALYAYLISQLPPVFNRSTVIMNFTRWPDLVRVPEIIAALLLVGLVISVWRNKALLYQPQTVFVASFALLPFLVFNQHIVTGRSVQPFHYEVFIANYAVLVGLVLFAHLIRPTIPRRLLLQLAVLSAIWGAIEVTVSFKGRLAADIRSDEMVPVLTRLKELSNHDGTWEGLRTYGRTPALVFSPQLELVKTLPTWAPQGSMLAPGASTFQSLTREARREALYLHLYYSAKDMNYLRELLNDKINDPSLTYHAKTTLFGPDRILPFLSADFRAISQEEIEKEVESYRVFADTISREQILKQPIAYLITNAQTKADLSQIDTWYYRDGGETVGNYNLYRLSVRR